MLITPFNRVALIIVLQFSDHFRFPEISIISIFARFARSPRFEITAPLRKVTQLTAQKYADSGRSDPFGGVFDPHFCKKSSRHDYCR
jgi:hypothetical protein